MSQWRSRMTKQAVWVVCCGWAVALSSFQPTNTLASDFPEAMPAYADPVGMRQDASLQAVAFANEQYGLAVGDRGCVLMTQDGGQRWDVQATDVECRLSDVLWLGEQNAIAVGGAYDRITGISRGVVLVSSDRGQTWRRGKDQELPRLRSLALRKDGRTVVAVGDWAAASLSCEFESRDGGKTWQNGGELDGPGQLPIEPSALALKRWSDVANVNTAIRDACRVGTEGLCAVGDHGVITQSRDGGKTWRTSRGDGRHSAILVFAATRETMPWPLIGNESFEMRNRVSVLLQHDDLFAQASSRNTKAHRSTGSDPVTAAPLELCRQAVVMLGGAGADRFIASDRSAIDSSRVKTTDESAVRSWLAIHQPSVMVVDQTLPMQVRSELVSAAMELGVARVVGYSFGSGGESMLHSNALLPTTGVLARDLWQDSLQLVSPHRVMPSSLAMRYLYDGSGTSKRGESMTVGLLVDEGQKLASLGKVTSRRQLQIVQGRMAQPERIAQLIRSRRTGDDFATGLTAILDQTAKDDQFRLAWSVGQQIASASERSPDLQSEWLRLISQRFATTSAGKWAELKINGMENSSEWKRLRSSTADSLSHPLQSTDENVVQAAEIVAVSPFQESGNRVVQATATAPLLVPKPKTLRRAQAKPTSAGIDLAWEFHPLVLLARDAAKNRGDEEGLQVAQESSGNLRRMSDDPRASAWSRLAPAKADDSVRTGVVAKRAATPPRLDGKLTEDFWTKHALARAGESRQLQVAYDDDYVYVAMEYAADQIAPDSVDPRDSQRVRDHRLELIDRVEFSIDVDQDLLTSMQFSVSDVGRTRDTIDGYPMYDPTWYVAVDRDSAMVRFEIAIQRRDVVDLPIVAGQSWLVRSRCLRAGNDAQAVMPDPREWVRVQFQ